MGPQGGRGPSPKVCVGPVPHWPHFLRHVRHPDTRLEQPLVGIDAVVARELNVLHDRVARDERAAPDLKDVVVGLQPEPLEDLELSDPFGGGCADVVHGGVVRFGDGQRLYHRSFGWTTGIEPAHNRTTTDRLTAWLRPPYFRSQQRDR